LKNEQITYITLVTIPSKGIPDSPSMEVAPSIVTEKTSGLEKPLEDEESTAGNK
jgi:hypothetical protein